LKRLLTACCLTLAVSSCVIAKDTYAPPTSTQARTAANAEVVRFESERRWGTSADTRWEPVVAAEPNSSWVYQMTTNQHKDYLLVRASSNGGRTWEPTRLVCRRGTRVPFQYDPQIAAVDGGIVDAVCLNGFLPGVAFAQSRDHGRTWSRSIRLDRPLRYSDKPILSVSSSGRNVYVAFNSYNALFVAASHDGGATWHAPVKATRENRWYYPYSAAMAPDGSVWFAVGGESGHDQTGNDHVELVTSADGGVTWRTILFAVAHEGAPCRLHNCYPDFFTAQDAVAVDRRGHYVFVFAKNESKQGPNALYVSRSNDGVGWSTPALFNGRGNSTSPAIVAGTADGDFRLVWQDNRNGVHAWNTWYARTRDGGESWSRAVRLSDRGSGAPYKSAAGYYFPFGDYLGLAADTKGVDYVIWGEGSAIYYPGGTWWTRD
jgi:hypothetical protein